MRIHLPLDLKLRTDLGDILDKNSSDRLIRSVQEFIKSVTETNSKIQEPKIYDRQLTTIFIGIDGKRPLTEVVEPKYIPNMVL